MRPELTAERLRSLLHYDPESGLFTWRVDRNQLAKVGSVAGRTDSHGHIQIGIDGRTYAAHRLAWLYVTGEWPARLVDHRDLVPGNNRWSNLREATSSQNNANCGPRPHNKSGFKGVSLVKATGRWSAKIKHQGRQHCLGTFSTPEDAAAAYESAAKRLFGEFARVA